jgi:inosine/xanthosine triphosphatase
MQVGVGSRNPVKLAATRQAFDGLAESARIAAVDVDSGVSEQPLGDEETVLGAKNRARAAVEGHDIGIGIEGGVAEGPDGWYLIMWAAATDGAHTEIGGGPRVRLPEGIGIQVGAGRELGPLMDELVGRSDVARNDGAAGTLTGGIIDRESALRHAVAGALGPFVTEFYDDGSR